jgi:hypothetical protein
MEKLIEKFLVSREARDVKTLEKTIAESANAGMYWFAAPED